jgi:predicted nucleic acid-binding Zn ribbon protein
LRKVGDILKDYLRERGWLTGNPYAPLFNDWNRIAGTGLASHARLVDVREGFMIVEVDHPGWMQMARMQKHTLLSAARAAAPEARITDIRFLLGGQDQQENHSLGPSRFNLPG